MANTSRPQGFIPVNTDDATVTQWTCTASETFKATDVVYMASTGRMTASASGVAVGALASNIIDVMTGEINATSAVGDLVNVFDCPFDIFKAQISTGALDSPYTTRSSAACYDAAGSAGVMYINAAASSNDTFKVLAPSFEADGSVSAVGAYQKVTCKFNLAAHFAGTIA